MALCEEGLAVFRTLGTKRWIALSLHLMGHAVQLPGDLERATGLYQESLALFGDASNQSV